MRHNPSLDYSWFPKKKPKFYISKKKKIFLGNIYLKPLISLGDFPSSRKTHIKRFNVLFLTILSCGVLTIVSCYFDASSRWEYAVPVFSTSHAWRFVNHCCIIVVEWVIASRIASIYGDAFEAIDRTANWNIKIRKGYFVIFAVLFFPFFERERKIVFL